MPEVASLVLNVDSSKATAAATALDRLTAAAKPAAAGAAALETASAKATVAQRAWVAAMSGVNGQLTAMAAGAGPVGVFLSALGPWGFAASLGLSAASKAFNYVTEESARMGQKAIDVNLFAEATGLTVAQIGALKRAGSEFGVSGDTMQTAMQRLTAGMEAAHQASGPLYDDILKIDPALAKQLQNAKSTAEGLDVLAMALRQVGSDSQKAALGKAMFARNWAGPTAALGIVADNGGLVKLAEDTRKLNDATDEQNKRWATMQAQINMMEGQGRNLFASIFTEAGLEAAHLAATYLRDAALAAKDLASQKESLTWWQKANIFVGATSFAPGSEKAIKQYVDSIKATREAAQSSSNGGTLGFSRSELNAIGDSLFRIASVQKEVASTTKDMQDAAAAASKDQATLVGFLGSGATIGEKLTATLTRLKSEYLDNKTGTADAAQSQSLYNRAVAAANLDAVIQRESLRNGLLGTLLTVSDAVLQKQHEINRANLQSAGITDAQSAAIKRRTELETESVKLSKQGQFGISDPLRQSKNSELELKTLIDDGTVRTAEQYAAAVAVIGKNFRNASEGAAVARSQFEQLTRYALDAQNSVKQWDQFATSGFGSLENGLASIVSGSATASAAFRSMTQSIIADLAKLVIRQGITGPAAAALSGLFSGVATPGNAGGTAGFLAPIHHTGYGPGDSFPTRLVNPAIFDHAPRYHSGIGPGERPAILRTDESVLTPAQMKAMGGRGGNITIAPVINVTGGGSDEDMRKTANLIADNVRTLTLETIRDQKRHGGMLA